MWIINNRKIFLSIAAAVMALSVGAISFFGFNPGIDFQGGSLLEVRYTEERPNINAVRTVVQEEGIVGAVIQEVDTDGVIVKTLELSDDAKASLTNGLSFSGEFPLVEERYKTLGPTVSQELKNKSLFAIALVVIAIILFIWYAFRGVSLPVSSFRYGLVAIIALVHDILIPTAAFAILGSFLVDYQMDVLFVTALLAILGFSVNDTIVVFDRVRENLKAAHDKKQEITHQAFRNIVGLSLSQTLRRSFYTSITTLLPLLFLFVLGGETTKPFALVLAIGVVAGTYSSIFIASPLLTLIEQHQKPPKKPEEKEIDPNMPSASIPQL